MRIGILTLPLHTNYGGILQAYALQTVLERMGHQVVVFDTPNKMPLPPLWKIPLTFAKRLFLKSMGRIDRIFIEKYNNQIRPVIAKEIQPFVDERIHRKVLTNFSTLEAHEFDAIVVGSDQIWRSIYFVPLWLWQKMEKPICPLPRDGTSNEYLMLLHLVQTSGNIMRNRPCIVKRHFKCLMPFLSEKRME